MLSIKKMGHGSEDYYLNLTRYYLGRRNRPSSADDVDGDDENPPFDAGEDGAAPELPREPAGQWLGGGCLALGLYGEVWPEELKPLMQGIHPRTGLPLVQNAGAANRVPGWDLTFSAPKSVSIIWSQADESFRRRIEEAQRRAVAKTIALAEAKLAFSRIGHLGTGYVPVQLIVAAFDHGTSRNADPQLHTHCLVLNVTVDEDEYTRTLFSRPIYVNRDLLGAYYRAVLAAELRKLGFRIKKHQASFEVQGVPADLISAWSTRRHEILAYLAREGRVGGASAAVAALETRKSKSELPPRHELFRQWQQHNALYGFTDVSDLLHDPRRHRQGSPQDAIDAAIRRISADVSHFTKTDFLEAVLQEAPALGLEPLPLLGAAADYAEHCIISTTRTSALISVGVHDGQQRFTTSEVLEVEQALLDGLETLRKRSGATVPQPLLDIAIDDQVRHVTHRAKKAGKARPRPPQLSAEQLAAVEHLTEDTLNTGSLRVVQGLAGTGKTDFVLAVAKRAWEDAGFRVIAATPTAKAGRVLARDTGMDTETVTTTLGDYELPWGCVLKHHLRQLKRAALGKTTYPLPRPKPIPLDANTILVVDEAGMLSTRHMRLLVEQAAKAGATLVLVGDMNQLPPVERGAPFGSIAERFGYLQLADIQRQQDAWARQVAKHAAKGEIGQALTILAEKQAIRPSETIDDAATDLVRHWAALGGSTTPEDVIVLADSNDATETLNQACQQERLRTGALSPAQQIQIHDIDKQEDRAYANTAHVGDRVLFTRNSKAIGVENGAIGTVLAIRNTTNTISVQLTTGEVVLVPVNRYPHLRLGYSVTTHKAQGDTYPHALVLVSEAQCSQPSFYVNVTRAKQSTTIFTTKSLWDPEKHDIAKSPLAKALRRRPDLRLASDLLRDAGLHLPPPTARPPIEIGSFVGPPASTGAPPEAPDDAPGSPTQTVPQQPRSEVGSATPPRPTYLVVPAAEIAAMQEHAPPRGNKNDKPRRPKKKRPVAPTNTTEPTDPTPIQPAQARKSRKKRRPGDVDTPWDPPVDPNQPPEFTLSDPLDEPQDGRFPEAMPADESRLASAAPAELADESYVTTTQPLLPDDFLAIPIPDLETWEPISTDAVPQPRVSLLPNDFLTKRFTPTARVIPSPIQSSAADASRGSQKPSEMLPMRIDDAKDPLARQRAVDDATDKLIADVSSQLGIPADRIEIINVRQWEEAENDRIVLWIEITYRITTHGPGALLNSLSFPILLW